MASEAIHPENEPRIVGAPNFDNELLAMAELTETMDAALQRSRPKGSQERIAEWFRMKYGRQVSA